MLNRQFLGLFLVFSLIFQNVSSTFLLLGALKNGIQKTKCKVHQIGAKIIPHNHGQGDPCDLANPVPDQNLDHPDDQVGQLQPSYENQPPQFGIDSQQPTEFQGGFTQERPQYLNGHSYGSFSNQKVDVPQDHFGQYSNPPEQFTPDMPYNPYENGHNYASHGQYYQTPVGGQVNNFKDSGIVNPENEVGPGVSQYPEMTRPNRLSQNEFSFDKPTWFRHQAPIPYRYTNPPPRDYQPNPVFNHLGTQPVEPIIAPLPENGFFGTTQNYEFPSLPSSTTNYYYPPTNMGYNEFDAPRFNGHGSNQGPGQIQSQPNYQSNSEIVVQENNINRNAFNSQANGPETILPGYDYTKDEFVKNDQGEWGQTTEKKLIPDNQEFTMDKQPTQSNVLEGGIYIPTEFSSTVENNLVSEPDIPIVNQPPPTIQPNLYSSTTILNVVPKTNLITSGNKGPADQSTIPKQKNDHTDTNIDMNLEPAEPFNQNKNQFPSTSPTLNLPEGTTTTGLVMNNKISVTTECNLPQLDSGKVSGNVLEGSFSISTEPSSSLKNDLISQPQVPIVNTPPPVQQSTYSSTPSSNSLPETRNNIPYENKAIFDEKPIDTKIISTTLKVPTTYSKNVETVDNNNTILVPTESNMSPVDGSKVSENPIDQLEKQVNQVFGTENVPIEIVNNKADINQVNQEALENSSDKFMSTTEIVQMEPQIDIRLGLPDNQNIASSTVSSTSTSTFTSTSTSTRVYATVPPNGGKNLGNAKANGVDNTKSGGTYAPILAHFG